MNDQQAREFVRTNRQAVLATIRRSGRPQLARVLYIMDDDGTLKISAMRTTAKATNIRRDPRVSLAVLGADGYQYLVVDGTARWAEDNLAAELRRYYERAAGKPHPNWQEYDEAMVKEKRVLLEITIERLYPLG
jgi:PPOX class probable F420-dependent enzyme